jgi:hypothetical protein
MTQRYSTFAGDHNIPSLLNVADFFAARAPEVVKLYSSMKLKSKFIPNHLRRRIRSFKPWFNRPRRKRTPRNPSKPLSRRTRRLLGLHLVESEGQKRRLAYTHIWHAKRFRMGNIWNMRLPTHVSNKGARAILRISTKGCVLHDRSYLDCWKLGEEVNFKSNGFEGIFDHAKVLSGEFFGSGFVKSDGLVISPFQLVYREESVFVWTHPSCRQEVEPIMKSMNGVLMNRQVRFELIGTRAIEVVSRVFGEKPNELIPGKVVCVDKIILNLRAHGRIVDVVFLEGGQYMYWWQRFIRAGSSPIGVYDRHELLSHLVVPDFPFDFPYSRSGAREAAIVAKSLVEKDARRPKHAKMNATSVESPFFSDWTLIGCQSRIPLESEVKCVCVISTRCVIKHNAHLHAGDQLVGYVTTSCGKEDLRAIGYVHQGFHGTEIEFQNPGSIHRFKAKLEVSKLKSTDSNLIGLVRV